MKTPIKKFTSVFLSLLMLVSIFTVSGSVASAVDTDNVSTGEHTVVLDASFCDSGGYAEWYAWTWTGDNEGHWVQASGGTSSSDITYQGIEDNVVFARMNPEKDIPNWNTETDTQIVWNQTDNLTVDGGKYVIDSWGDGWGAKLTGHWEDGGGDNPNPGGGGTTGDYYLVGYINSVDVEGNDYHFENGQLTLSVTSDTYVAVKNGSGEWYMTHGFPGMDATSTTLYKTYYGEEGTDKFFVPTGEITLTLTENSDGTLTISYSNGGGGGGDDPQPTGDYYLVGYINAVDVEGNDYPFVNGQLTLSVTDESYVAVKNSAGEWYMTHGFPGMDATSTTLYKTYYGEEGTDKFYLPTGELTLTLSENGDGTLTISYSNGGGDITDPVITDPVVTDPVVTDPVVTDPPTDPPTTPTSSVTSPVVTTQPASTIPTDPTYDDEDKNLYVSAKSNINIAGSKVKANGNTISVSFTIKAPEKLDDGQFFVTYDSSKLYLSSTYNTQSSMFPVAKNATYNLDAKPSMIMFNFSGTEGAYDFTNGGVLINLVFTRKSASTVGTALVYLNVCDLNSKNTSYVDDGNIKNSTGLEVGQTVSEPVVTEPKDDDVATDANPNLTVNAYSNINHEIQKIVVDKNNVKVTFKMTVPELIAYGKGVVTYDSDKLALEAKYNTQSSMFTTLNSQTIYNLKAGTGTMMFSFTSADPSTQSGTYDFRTGGDVISLVFTLKQGATGSADVYLDLIDLGTFTKDYIEQGKSTPSTGDVTSNVILEAQTATTSSTDETSIPIASSTGGDVTTPTDDSSGSTTPNTSEPATSPTANTTAKPAPKPTQPTTAAKPSKDVGKGTPVASADKFVKNLKNDKDPKGSVFNGLKAKSSKVKKTSIKVTWSKVKKAKGYIVYGNKCGKSYKKIKTVKGTSYTQKKLKKGTYYKYLIMAYDKNNKILSTSKTLHVATTGGKYGNYKSVKLNKTKISLKKGKTYKLKATCKKQSKKLKVKDHRKVKYESTKTKIATVSSSGKIKAKKKGTCYIYAYAQNGVYKKAKVTVKK